MFFNKTKNSKLGTYPSCDHVNVALTELLKHPKENKSAIEELCHAVVKSNGYFYDYVKQELKNNGFESFVVL